MSISSSLKFPGTYFEIFFGAGRQSPGSAPKKAVLCAYGGGGTGSSNIVYGAHGSADDVKTIHGAGKPLHLGAVAFFEEHPFGTLYTLQYAEAGGGTATTKTLTIANNATATGTLTLDINGRYVQVTVTSGDTPTVQGDAVVAKVNAESSLPVTAANLVGVVTFTMKWKGPTSQQFQLRYSVESITGSTYAIAAGVSGATDGSPTSALDEIHELDADYLIVQVDHNTSGTGLSTFLAYVNSRAEPEVGLRGCMIAAFTGSYANAVTLSTTQNAHREQLVWDRGSNMFSIEIAAKIAALRAKYEESDPTVNLIFNGGRNRTFTNWRGPYAASDKITKTEANNALNNGISPIQYTPQNAARIVRNITTRFQDLNGGPDYRTLDVIKVNMLDWFADDLAADWPVRFPNYKLQPDPDGPVADEVADARLIKSWIMTFLRDYEGKGWVKYVTANEDGVTVAISNDGIGRATARIPVDVIDLFAQLDANLYQVG